MSGLLIITLIIAATVLFYFVPEKVQQPEVATPKPRYVQASEKDEDWRDKFASNVESPAEIAFLNAMIDAFALTPKLGALSSNGLRLDLQVEQGRYRADFMLNYWLIIEIDGAAWHSSDEAKIRDRKRDIYFEGLGFTVLRIPAKITMNRPAEAVRRVEAALSIGKRHLPAPKMEVQKSGFQRLAETGSLIAREFANSGEFVQQQRVVAAAISPAERAFELEQKMVRSAILIARRAKAEREAGGDLMSASGTTRYVFDLEERLIGHETPQMYLQQSSNFPPDLETSGPYSEIIKERFEKLKLKRADFFTNIKSLPQVDEHIFQDAISILLQGKHYEIIDMIN